jgi:hypothetical protein
MILIAVAFGAIVLFFIAFKVLRMVMSGCMKLVILAILVGVAAAAWFSFRHRIIYPYRLPVRRAAYALPPKHSKIESNKQLVSSLLHPS